MAARGASALVPAAALAGAAPAEWLERASANRAVETFVKLTGGREALVETLELAGSSPDVQKVLELLADPRYERMSLARICALAGLTVADFFAAFRTARLQRAQIEAIELVAQGLAPVVADVMRRAAPYDVACTACRGTGSVSTGDAPSVPCETCHGKGAILEEPDLDRQKLALELAELLKKGGGLTISQTNQTVTMGAGAGLGTLERVQQAVSGLRAGAPLVFDVDPMPPCGAATADDPSPADVPTALSVRTQTTSAGTASQGDIVDDIPPGDPPPLPAVPPPESPSQAA